MYVPNKNNQKICTISVFHKDAFSDLNFLEQTHMVAQNTFLSIHPVGA
jgi:hypothetical protein